ncbi:unnamed protein product [Lota lota]
MGGGLDLGGAGVQEPGPQLGPEEAHIREREEAGVIRDNGGGLVSSQRREEDERGQVIFDEDGGLLSPGQSAVTSRVPADLAGTGRPGRYLDAVAWTPEGSGCCESLNNETVVSLLCLTAAAWTSMHCSLMMIRALHPGHPTFCRST